MLSTLAFSSGFSVSRSPVSQGRAGAPVMLYGEPRPVQIIPSVLPADWANMGAE